MTKNKYMKTLIGIFAAIAVYILIWFIQTVLPVEFTRTGHLVFMTIAFCSGYYLYEPRDHKSLKNSSCDACGHMNEEICNTCSIINP
jgi:hypothetical protein